MLALRYSGDMKMSNANYDIDRGAVKTWWCVKRQPPSRKERSRQRRRKHKAAAGRCCVTRVRHVAVHPAIACRQQYYAIDSGGSAETRTPAHLRAAAGDAACEDVGSTFKHDVAAAASVQRHRYAVCTHRRLCRVYATARATQMTRYAEDVCDAVGSEKEESDSAKR